MKHLFLLLLAVSLYSQERIELYTYGFFAPETLETILANRGNSQTVVALDIEKFRKKKINLGLKIDNEVSKWVFMNVPRSAGRKFRLDRLPKEKAILFMWEPPIRLRKMYSEKVQRCFSRIYTFRDDLVDGKTYFKLHYPVLQSMREQLPSFEERKFCTMIVGATSDKSRHHPNELYSKRIEAIRFFEEHHPEDFEYYGYNWDPQAFPSYRGEASDKHAVNQHYRFSICYENCRDVPGYITEKIFDCFAVGSIPVYWGANNVFDYIPKDCFVDRRDFADLEELYQFLKAMTKEEYLGYLSRIRAFLSSEQAQRFSHGVFEELLVGELERSPCLDSGCSTPETF